MLQVFSIFWLVGFGYNLSNCPDLDTRVILPVTHGLFEERLMHPAEVRVDLVGDYGVVPYPLAPCRRRTPE